MTDREKVIKGIQECDLNGGLIGNCPYKGILSLLKEQEAVEPKKADNPEESEYCCGICGYPLWLDELYCAHCGRRVLWEGR